jgi:hypothetical protein
MYPYDVAAFARGERRSTLLLDSFVAHIPPRRREAASESESHEKVSRELAATNLRVEKQRAES